MLLEIFTKPDNESIIQKELDMKSDDQVLTKNESEDSFYDYYYCVNSNIIVCIPKEVGSEIVSKNFESSNDLASSPPYTVQIGVIEAGTETREILPVQILSESHCSSAVEEIDISEALLPYLYPVELDVEADNKNLKECGISLAPRHDHTNAKQPELDNDSFDSDEVDVTTVDNDFLTLFREECKKQVKRQGGGDLQAVKCGVTQCSSKKKARRSALPAQNRAKRKVCPAQNGANGIVQQKSCKKEEIGKCISAETYIYPDGARQMYVSADYNGAQSPILSFSGGTSEGKMLCGVDSTYTSASLSICSSSELDPMDEKDWDMFLARKCLKQNEMDDLRFSNTRYSDIPEGVHQKRDENKDMDKGIYAATSNGAQSLISRTSTGTTEGRMLCRVDSTSTFASSSSCRSSELDPIDEREGLKFLARKCRKKQKEFLDNLQISVAGDNPGGVQKKRGKKEMNKYISPETDSGIESSIPSTSSETSRKRKRKLGHKDISSSSISRNSHERDELDHRNKRKSLGKKYRKIESELMEDLRLLTAGDNPKIQKVKTLNFAREYIEELKQNLEAKRKLIKDLRNKNKSLWRKFGNLTEELDNTPLSWFR